MQGNARWQVLNRPSPSCAGSPTADSMASTAAGLWSFSLYEIQGCQCSGWDPDGPAPADGCLREAGEAEPPPNMAGTHYDDQAERYPGQAPEDFPRGVGLGGHVNPDRPPDEELSPDPEMNIVPTDAKGG